MVNAANGLLEVKAEVEAGQPPRRTVRELLSWFGAQRRGVSIIAVIEDALRDADLITEPDFRTTWIDAEVTFQRASSVAQTRAESVATTPAPMGPEYLVRMLESANRGVISVNPDDGIATAVTLMMMHDYSQLAVMTGERNLIGAISWKSIGMRLSQKASLTKVRDATEDDAEWVDETASLFDVVGKVIERDFVFVRRKDKTVSGIVTASDLSRQFHALSEPFLILGRIEAHLRQLIAGAFDVAELRAAVDEADVSRKANLINPSQLNFGEYKRLLERDENWKKLGFVACRKTFCAALDDVRQLRNEIMHFHPDKLEGRDHGPLKNLLQLLETLKEIAVETGVPDAQSK